MKFVVFTHVEHIEREGRYYAYAPYVREMNLWLRHVEEVEVVSPQAPEGGDLFGEAYSHTNIISTSIPAFNLLSISAFFKSVLQIPIIFFKILGAMRRADHLHLRCPGNVGLIACIGQIFFPTKPKTAKYAGNWDPKAKQPWTYRFQKWILNNTFLTRNMQVLVYGEWPDQSKNILSFFTASFAEGEKAEVFKKTFSEPFIFLFVGNLVEGKRPLETIKLVEAINKRNEKNSDQEIPVSLEIYGVGPERQKLENYVKEKKLEEFITFKGSRPLEELRAAYQKAHFVVLPSKSEGWPKAIAEGMFFGCIPIATPVSCVPWMLKSPPAPEGEAKKHSFAKRGILIEAENFRNENREESGERKVERENQEPGTKSQDGKKKCLVVNDQWSEDIVKIRKLLADPQQMKNMSEEAKNWSQQYTLERFEQAIKKVLLYPNEEINITNGKPSPAPFRDGVKRGKGHE